MVGTGRFELEPICVRERKKKKKKKSEGSHARAPRTLLFVRLRYAAAHRALGCSRSAEHSIPRTYVIQG